MKNVNPVFYLLIAVAVAFAGLSFAQTTFALTSPWRGEPTTQTRSDVFTDADLQAQKCGVKDFAVRNECGVGVFKNAQIQCHDGYKENIGGESSCKPSDVWKKYGEGICANRCSVESGSGSKPMLPNLRPKPEPRMSKEALLADPIGACVLRAFPDMLEEYDGLILALQKSEQAGDKEGIKAITSKILALEQAVAQKEEECRGRLPVPIGKPITVCVIPDGLMKEYNELILALQKPANREVPAKEAEATTSKIIALKQRIAESQKECDRQSTSIAGPIGTTGVVSSRATIDRCAEVAQWENKIAYYKKLSALSDTEFKNSGFSRTEIEERILPELSAGIEKVKAQCGNQQTVETKPTEVFKQIITESVKPVAVESGQEIGDYYKARIGKITASTKNTEEQITGLKTLRSEIDELIANLIKSRKEIEASEFNNLVEEVKISKGVIKADNVSVEAADKKIFVEVGNKPLSIESTGGGVLIKDKDLKVQAAEVSIKDGRLEVGGAEVKMPASEVVEKLGLAPQTIELKEENAKAVYDMKIEERRKLFGLIPLTVSKVITADAKSGIVMEELAPWYTFLTIKR